jgi:hypothetical protein
MADILGGKSPSLANIPPEVIVFLLATQTGWTIEYIKSLSEKDYKVFAQLSLLKEKFNVVNSKKL